MYISDFWCGFLACVGIELAFSLLIAGATALIKGRDNGEDEEN